MLYDQTKLIVTGSDAYHFSNLCVLIGSWKINNPLIPLAVCDYGLLPDQIEELKRIEGLFYLSNISAAFVHPWEGKAALKDFLTNYKNPWEILIWIDADALFLNPYPDLCGLMVGYDMILDAHIESIGHIMHECNREVLNVRRDDAYFSAGCWIARKGVLLDTYKRLTALVRGKGNLWECDAFVASIYHESLKIRTVNGGIWHSRGKTSLSTCEVRSGQVYHEGQLVYVIHANAHYDVQKDGRRIFNRADLAEIQNYYLNYYKTKLQNNLVV